MNRMEEFRELNIELEKEVPEMTNMLEHAYKRKRRRDWVYGPLLSVASIMFLFVFLVNTSATVAHACAKVPILRELAEVVTFSRSLSSAVENEYVQPMNLKKQDGDVTATVEYLIVDQKQVNVFYRLESKQYELMDCDPKVKREGCSYYMSKYETESGELSCLTIDFGDGNVPDTLEVELSIRDALAYSSITGDSEEISRFTFELKFDPEFKAEGKKIQVNQTVVLEGQHITITDMEIYPTHMRVNVTDDAKNTAWLKRLYFHILADGENVFDSAQKGIISTGSIEEQGRVSFRADSIYFYEAEKLELVITGAEWLRKDMKKIYVNLETGETDPLPERVELYSAAETSDGWELKLKVKEWKENEIYGILNMAYYDMDGSRHEVNSIAWYPWDEEGYYIEGITFTGYHEKEVWISPQYSHRWEAKEPIVVHVR